MDSRLKLPVSTDPISFCGLGKGRSGSTFFFKLVICFKGAENTFRLSDPYHRSKKYSPGALPFSDVREASKWILNHLLPSIFIKRTGTNKPRIRGKELCVTCSEHCPPDGLTGHISTRDFWVLDHTPSTIPVPYKTANRKCISIPAALAPSLCCV